MKAKTISVWPVEVAPGRVWMIESEGAEPPPAGSMAPFERVRSGPEELSGAEGANRHRGPHPAAIAANNDLEALNAWLRQYADSPHTQRSYAKEANRLFWWAQTARGLPVSSLGADDLADFFSFLANPPEAWMSASRAQRGSALWRPLRGPLKESSVNQSRVILKACFEWLVEARYLAGNPIALTRKRRSVQLAKSKRYLPRPAWNWLRSCLDALPELTLKQRQIKARAKHLFALLYLTAARLGEAANARMGDLSQEEDGSWWWRLIGKGQKEGAIPVTQELLDSIRDYRVFYGLGPLPSPGEKWPLVMRLAGPVSEDALSENMVYRAARSAFADAASAATNAGREDLAARLREASTHWMRHTAITHQADAGMDLRTIQENARHGSIATTSRYLHQDDRRRHRETSDKHRMDGDSADA